MVDPWADQNDTEQAPWPEEPEDGYFEETDDSTSSKERKIETSGYEGKIVTTIKFGAGYEAPWVVIHADSVEESTRILNDPNTPGYLDLVAKVAQHARRTSAPPAPQRSNGWNGGGQQTPQASGQAPVCQHGTKTLINGKFGPFWGCPADRNDPTRCKPQKYYG